MGRHARHLMVVGLVLVAATAAAANGMLAATPPGGTATAGTTLAATTPAGTSSGTTIDQIVSLTRAVDPGTTALSVFTVPAGQLLVVTDALITNPSPSPACGASISPGGGSAPLTMGTTAATTGVVVTPTAIESGTGVLCVPAQTSLTVGLTTGMEFMAGQSVVLGNTTLPATSATLHFHLRGFLATTSS